MYCDNPYSLSFGPNYGLPVDQPPDDLSRFTENWGNGPTPFRQSLVLDAEKDELVKASGGTGKETGASETKTKAALKSHCEAERRRREKINAHLLKLRDLVPNNEKVSKCSLLPFIRYIIYAIANDLLLEFSIFQFLIKVKVFAPASTLLWDCRGL